MFHQGETDVVTTGVSVSEKIFINNIAWMLTCSMVNESNFVYRIVLTYFACKSWNILLVYYIITSWH